MTTKTPPCEKCGGRLTEDLKCPPCRREYTLFWLAEKQAGRR